MAIVNGVHILIYSSNAEADRGFFRDVLGFKYVDVGHGWLIFGLPPAEAAFHPVDGNAGQHPAGHAMLGSVVYLMCDDLTATIKALAAKHVACTEVQKEQWGIRTTVKLPSGGEFGLYQPTHEVAYKLGAPAVKKASAKPKRVSKPQPKKKSRRR
jgi:catechol 2,3-dioxygenase-like lactoylglutathione lyase family enzyme